MTLYHNFHSDKVVQIHANSLVTNCLTSNSTNDIQEKVINFIGELMNSSVTYELSSINIMYVPGANQFVAIIVYFERK